MKNLILTLLVCFLYQTEIKCQNWFPIGAEWYFNFQMQLNYPYHAYTKYTVQSDTIINSMNAKKITFKTGNSGKTSTVFVYEENSKVFRWTGNEFKLMYDLNLDSGDTLDVEVIKRLGCDIVSPIIVDSVNYIQNYGETLLVQYLSCSVNTPPQNYYINYKVIEKIGRVENFIFIPECGIDIEPWVSLTLRCYKDNDMSYTSDWWSVFCPNSPCDTIIDGSTNIINDWYSQQIKIFPNPCQDFLNIGYSSSTMNKVVLYNSMGLLIDRYEPDSNFINFNTESMGNGIYYVVIETEDRIFRKRIIKL